MEFNLYSKTNVEDSAILKISTFRGISFGASHFYGKLTLHEPRWTTWKSGDPDNEVRLTRTLTEKDAQQLTKLRNDFSLLGGTYSYSEGAEVESFDTRTDVINAAKLIWREKFPTAVRLLIGDAVYDQQELVENR